MLTKIRSHFRQFGLLPGLKLLVLGRLKRLFYIESFLFMRLDRDRVPAPSPARDGVVIRTIAHGEDALCVATIGRRQMDNETVFIAERDGKVRGYALTQQGGSYGFGKGSSAELPADVLMLKGLFVDLSERGRKLGHFLNQARVSADHCAGKSVFVSAMVDNRAALKNLHRIGFVEYARSLRAQILGRTVYRGVRACSPDVQLPQWMKDFR